MAGTFMADLQDTDQIDITVTGRVTGRQFSVPVWFVADHGNVDLLPVRGSDSDWYKNVLATPSLRLTANGASIAAAAIPITDPARVQQVVEMFRAKYGVDQIAAFYSKTDVALDVRLPD